MKFKLDPRIMRPDGKEPVVFALAVGHIDDYRVEALTYDICGRTSNGNILWNPNSWGGFRSAEPILRVCVKWDGELIWHRADDDCAVQPSGPYEAAQHIVAGALAGRSILRRTGKWSAGPNDRREKAWTDGW